MLATSTTEQLNDRQLNALISRESSVGGLAQLIERLTPPRAGVVGKHADRSATAVITVFQEDQLQISKGGGMLCDDELLAAVEGELWLRVRGRGGGSYHDRRDDRYDGRRSENSSSRGGGYYGGGAYGSGSGSGSYPLARISRSSASRSVTRA